MGFTTSHRSTMFHLCLREEPHTHLMGFITRHRGTQRSISVSERNNTPISWAHPTHGLSHRTTHSFCVLEDVSRSCNHRHSLSAREAFSTRPSLSRKYSNFVLGEDISILLVWRKVLHGYCFPLHHIFDIMVFDLNVFRFIMKHMIL